MALTLSNQKKSYVASAPGSLMLLGEHAVLNQREAIVLAVDKRVKVTLKPRNDSEIYIGSALGNFNFSLEALGKGPQEMAAIPMQKRFEFVLAAIASVANKLEKGFELSIVSEFSNQVGLGSSAAVTVATLAVLNALLHPNHTQESNHLSAGQPSEQEMTSNAAFLYYLFTEAKAVIQAVQGVGSGADAAASVYGGIVVYQQKAPSIKMRLSHLPPITVRYSGYKTPTPLVIGKVREQQKKYPEIYDDVFNAMQLCVDDAVPAIEKQDWQSLGKIMTVQQGLMRAIGVSTPEINQLIEELNSTPGILGAKISGSGLGDCVIGIGKPVPKKKSKSPPANEIPVSASLRGVAYE